MDTRKLIAHIGRTFDRDPFARYSFIEYRRLRRPSDHTCTWCGNSSARWSITYTVDPDAGRPHDIRGTYCSRSCFRTLNT